MLALLRRRRLGTATSSAATNGSDVAKQWSTWTSIEAAQLNWMRNALSSSGLGLALIHFRREIDGAPPLGGLVLVALGLGYSYSGAAVYLSAAWQLRRTLGLGAASGAALVGHALLAPGALTTAALCFADRTPAWVALGVTLTLPHTLTLALALALTLTLALSPSSSLSLSHLSLSLTRTLALALSLAPSA